MANNQFNHPGGPRMAPGAIVPPFIHAGLGQMFPIPTGISLPPPPPPPPLPPSLEGLQSFSPESARVAMFNQDSSTLCPPGEGSTNSPLRSFTDSDSPLPPLPATYNISALNVSSSPSTASFNDSDSSKTTPDRKANTVSKLPLLGKLEAKKRLLAFSGKTAGIVNKLSKPGAENVLGESQSSGKSEVSDGKKLVFKKKKKEEKTSVMEQIKKEEDRIKQALGVHGASLFNPFSSSYIGLLDNPESLKKLEEKGRRYISMLEKRRQEEARKEQEREERKKRRAKEKEEERMRRKERDKSKEKEGKSRKVDHQTRLNETKKTAKTNSDEKLRNSDTSHSNRSKTSRQSSKERAKNKSEGREAHHHSREYKKHSHERSKEESEKSLHDCWKDWSAGKYENALREDSTRLMKDVSALSIENQELKVYKSRLVEHTVCKPNLTYSVNPDQYEYFYHTRNMVRLRNSSEHVAILDRVWNAVKLQCPDNGEDYSELSNCQPWYEANWKALPNKMASNMHSKWDSDEEVSESSDLPVAKLSYEEMLNNNCKTDTATYESLDTAIESGIVDEDSTLVDLPAVEHADNKREEKSSDLKDEYEAFIQSLDGTDKSANGVNRQKTSDTDSNILGNCVHDELVSDAGLDNAGKLLTETPSGDVDEEERKQDMNVRKQKKKEEKIAKRAAKKARREKRKAKKLAKKAKKEAKRIKKALLKNKESNLQETSNDEKERGDNEKEQNFSPHTPLPPLPNEYVSTPISSSFEDSVYSPSAHTPPPPPPPEYRAEAWQVASVPLPSTVSSKLEHLEKETFFVSSLPSVDSVTNVGAKTLSKLPLPQLFAQSSEKTNLLLDIELPPVRSASSCRAGPVIEQKRADISPSETAPVQRSVSESETDLCALSLGDIPLPQSPTVDPLENKQEEPQFSVVEKEFTEPSLFTNDVNKFDTSFQTDKMLVDTASPDGRKEIKTIAFKVASSRSSAKVVRNALSSFGSDEEERQTKRILSSPIELRLDSDNTANAGQNDDDGNADMYENVSPVKISRDQSISTPTDGVEKDLNILSSSKREIGKDILDTKTSSSKKLCVDVQIQGDTCVDKMQDTTSARSSHSRTSSPESQSDRVVDSFREKSPDNRRNRSLERDRTKRKVERACEKSPTRRRDVSPERRSDRPRERSPGRRRSRVSELRRAFSSDSRRAERSPEKWRERSPIRGRRSPSRYRGRSPERKARSPDNRSSPLQSRGSSSRDFDYHVPRHYEELHGSDDLSNIPLPEGSVPSSDIAVPQQIPSIVQLQLRAEHKDEYEADEFRPEWQYESVEDNEPVPFNFLHSYVGSNNVVIETSNLVSLPQERSKVPDQPKKTESCEVTNEAEGEKEEGDSQEPSPSGSPKRLSLEDRLAREHGLSLHEEEEPPPIVPPVNVLWKPPKFSEKTLSHSPASASMAQVGNILEMLPVDIQKNLFPYMLEQKVGNISMAAAAAAAAAVATAKNASAVTDTSLLPLIAAAAAAEAAAREEGASPSQETVTGLLSLIHQLQGTSVACPTVASSAEPEPVKPDEQPELNALDLVLLKEQQRLAKLARKERKEQRRKEREERRAARRAEMLKGMQTPQQPTSDEEDEALIREAMTEEPNLGSPVAEYQLEAEDAAAREEAERQAEADRLKRLEKYMPAPAPDRGILMSPTNKMLGSGPSKSVKFADGVLPGEGTSPSGGEDIHSPPPPCANEASDLPPKEKKLRKRNRPRTRHIKLFECISESDVMSASPPPPPASPPPGFTPIFLYPGYTKYTLTQPGTALLYTHPVPQAIVCGSAINQTASTATPNGLPIAAIPVAAPFDPTTVPPPVVLANTGAYAPPPGAPLTVPSSDLHLFMGASSGVVPASIPLPHTGYTPLTAPQFSTPEGGGTPIDNSALFTT